jgi:hypothetical protein
VEHWLGGCCASWLFRRALQKRKLDRRKIAIYLLLNEIAEFVLQNRSNRTRPRPLNSSKLLPSATCVRQEDNYLVEKFPTYNLRFCTPFPQATIAIDELELSEKVILDFAIGARNAIGNGIR